MKIFVICTVRSAVPEYRDMLERYVNFLESCGHKVHLPHRDTDQDKKEFKIMSRNVAAIRERFSDLVIWGSVSSQRLFAGTPAEVAEESRRIIDEADGRGYFHGCSNAIVKGTPPANVEAMFSVR